MTNHPLPIRFGALTLPDVERLGNGVRMLRCGRERDVIRAPYQLGVTAYAFLRWQRQPIGDVLAHRKQHVYFLIPAGTGPQWDALLTATGTRGMPLRLIGDGGLVMLPLICGRFVRWLRGPGFGPLRPAADVLGALRAADERLITRGMQRVADQEAAHAARQASAALTAYRARADRSRE